MQKLNYLLLTTLLSLLFFSCTTKEKDNKIAEATEITTSVEANPTEATSNELEKYQEEIKMIRDFFLAINEDVDKSDIEPEYIDKKIKGQNASITNYFDEEKQLVKQKVTIGEESWTYIYKIYANRDSKLVYTQYANRGKTDTDTKRIVFREIFSIGSLKEDSNEHFGLVVKNKNEQVLGQELIEIETKSEEIWLAVSTQE